MWGCRRIVYHDPSALIRLYGTDRMLEQIQAQCGVCRCTIFGARLQKPMRNGNNRFPMPVAILDYSQKPRPERRTGAKCLADLDTRNLEIECIDCRRYGRWPVKTLIERHGADANVPGLLTILTQSCPRHAKGEIWDRCRARFLN